jgi:hypothetical protein
MAAISEDTLVTATMPAAVEAATGTATDVASAEEDVALDLIIAVAEDAIHPDLARLTPDLATRSAIKSHTASNAEDTRCHVQDLSHPEG